MLERCIRRIKEYAQHRMVSRAVVGPGFVAVQLDDSSLGLCATIENNRRTSCMVYPNAGLLAGSQANDLLALSARTDFVSRSLALATVNALASQAFVPTPGDVFERVAIATGDRVVMVGFIEPVVEKMAGLGCEISVFEHRETRSPFVKAPATLPERVRAADVVILTGTTLVNGSIKDILALPRRTDKVILIGPSTPMIPDAFEGTGIGYLAGSRIMDADKAFTVIMEGGGTRRLNQLDATRKAYMEVG